MSAALDEKNQSTDPASFACLLALTLVLQLFNFASSCRRSCNCEGMNAALINCRQAHMNPVSQLLLEINIKKRPRQQKKEQASQPASQEQLMCSKLFNYCTKP
jgi:hypothetical protein